MCCSENLANYIFVAKQIPEALVTIHTILLKANANGSNMECKVLAVLVSFVCESLSAELKVMLTLYNTNTYSSIYSGIKFYNKLVR